MRCANMRAHAWPRARAPAPRCRSGPSCWAWARPATWRRGPARSCITLKFSRSDETDADLVGLELAARAGYDPRASVSLWNKMAKASKNEGGLSFLSTHPSGPDRIRMLEANVPKVEGLYRAAKRG